MNTEAAGIKRIILAVGYTDLRKGIDGLAQIVGTKYNLNPFEKGVLFLFCGRRSDRIKGLLWVGTGFILLYERWESGSLIWPRTPEQAAEITPAQLQMLLSGLNPLRTGMPREVYPHRIY